MAGLVPASTAGKRLLMGDVRVRHNGDTARRRDVGDRHGAGHDDL
jgi:hypothetical protein